jgi:hypothetical protein
MMPIVYLYHLLVYDTGCKVISLHQQYLIVLKILPMIIHVLLSVWHPAVQRLPTGLAGRGSMPVSLLLQRVSLSRPHHAACCGNS